MTAQETQQQTHQKERNNNDEQIEKLARWTTWFTLIAFITTIALTIIPQETIAKIGNYPNVAIPCSMMALVYMVGFFVKEFPQQHKATKPLLIFLTLLYCILALITLLLINLCQ